MSRAFVIRPFGTKKDGSGKEIDFERIDRELIGPALEACGFEGGTTGELIEPGNIREDIFALILEADLVVCDISVLNANVFYELGIRHALRKRRTVQIKVRQSSDATPFDVQTDRYLTYDLNEPATARDKLAETISAAMASERPTDSPIFQLLPNLPEADPSTVVLVPLEFKEEVNRAQAAKSKGWLRLLSEEVVGLRFQWEGLRLVACAQGRLRDYEGAWHSWEAIRETYPQDIEANLALANIYEHMYRETKDPEWFEASEQAICRVLSCCSAGRKERAEALAFKGRNEKTRWRVAFKDSESVEERRKAAMNRALIRSYEAYRDAFFEDLNQFYSGLSALQMGTILLDLAQSDEWLDAFNTDAEAGCYRVNLQEDVSSLRSLVPVLIEAALHRMDEADADRVWARISIADVLFLLDSGREARIIGAYRDALPRNNPSAWEAIRGQLTLYAELGVQAELAKKVIEAIDPDFSDGEQKKPVHLIIFVGHRVDEQDRAESRFPREKENAAKGLIHEEIRSLVCDQCDIVLLSSAAPGSDILAHEVCADLGLKSIICLPMPPEDFAQIVFGELDSWRTRFIDLQKNHKVLVLSEREGLPRWLHASGADPWERGNRWVLKMALTWGARTVTLVALWDGKKTGDDAGGTAHMVKLAEETGKIHIRRIDSTQLVEPPALIAGSPGRA